MTDLDTTSRTEHELFTSWTIACRAAAVTIDRGVAVLIDDTPIAIFRLSAVGNEPEQWFAVSHIDPFSGAPVIARGLVGSTDVGIVDAPTVASPIHKQRFDLRSGRCLDDDEVHLTCYPVRVRNGLVEVRTEITNL